MTHEKYELAVIGAGPSGMAAATMATKLGVETIVLDEQGAPGGQIYRNIEEIARRGEWRVLGNEYRHGADVARDFRSSTIVYSPRTEVWQTAADGRIGVRTGANARIIHAERILLATGALERPVAVPGWTMPGVMGAGGAQALLKASGLVPQVPVVIAGSGPLLYLVAAQFARAGCTVAALLVTTPANRIVSALRDFPRALLAGNQLLRGIAWMNEVRRAGIPTFNGVTNLRIEGAAHAEAVTYTLAGTRRRVAAGLVLLHEGVIPDVQLSLSARCRHTWDDGTLSWRPDADSWGATSQERIAVAGDCGGVRGAEAAELLGRLAAMDAAFRLGRIGQAERDRLALPERKALARLDRIRSLLNRLFRPLPEALASHEDETVVCRCEEVTLAALKEAIRLGADDPSQAKLFTRCGMGPCQGRMCGPTVGAVIARETDRAISDVGTYRIRIPTQPLPIAALASLVDDSEDSPGAEATP